MADAREMTDTEIGYALSPDVIVRMLGLRPISGGADGKDSALIFGKYKTQEEAEKGFKELEAKLGTQGTELGEMKKVIAQYQPWVEKAIPVVEWYGKHADKVNQWVQKGMPVEAPAPAAASAADATARAAAANTAGYEWLTPQEKQGLVSDIRNAILTETLKPWTESFTQQAQKFATDMANRFDHQHKSFTDVMWQTLSRTVPKDKMDEARAWHEAALRFADPSKIDPMKMGDEFIGLHTENAGLKAKLAEAEKRQSEFEKASVPSLFGSASPDSASSTDTATPESREDRFKAVMGAVQAEHGPEGLRTLFDVPSLSR